MSSTINFDKFDVIVVGGGHAGTEAATAAARMGSKTLLLTHNIETLGQMSCNPAIGGIGKGHLVKEIDALDGIMAQAIDKAGIQFRILNSSKGPAVRATRAQADRFLYRKNIREILENYENLTIFQQAVDDLIIENDNVIGVVTQIGIKFFAKAVVLTVGTFLGGKIHIGLQNHQGGRAGDPPSIKLAERLRALPFNVERLKTGTPPRIDGKTIDFSKMKTQPGDDPLPVFSFLGSINDHPQQIPCFITNTNEKTHDIIRDGLKESPLFTGVIEGVGPRYCPSIEDKVVRFSEKNSHQIFVEPEGLTVNEYYPNGLSTSLSFETQLKYIRSINGFENANITRPGYAIEYDFFDPRDLKYSLETRFIKGLFFAGQINGTTGYEEAAAQGIVAGINAGLLAQDKEPFILGRDESYIGVMIDDLITLGTKEPYRMFTSRAEYRLLLREDNADERLTEKGYKIGVVKEHRFNYFYEAQNKILSEENRLRNIFVQPKDSFGQKIAEKFDKNLSHEDTIFNLLKRPDLDYEFFKNLDQDNFSLDYDLANKMQIKIRYSGYIERQRKEIEVNKNNERKKIPEKFNYRIISGLSNEVVEKLEKIKPETVGQATRISGVTPAAISLILIYLKKGELESISIS